MCGIGGIALFPKERTTEELAYIRILAKNIAVENQVRGSDSTGFAAFSQKGFGIFKHPLPAKKLTETKAYNEFMAKSLNKNTKSLLIHTRAGTKGSEKNNLNNHPIESARYIGVHNGIIWNDDELFESMKLHRAAEVDSEIIFRLLDTVGEKPNGEGLQWVAEKLQGAFTTAFVPKKERTKLYLIRNDNPVTLVFIRQLNIIAFASQKKFLEDAIADANEYTSITISQEDHNIWVDPGRQTIYSFDMAGYDAEIQMLQNPQKFTENWHYNSWDRHNNVYGTRYYEDEYFFRGGATKIAREQEEEVPSIASILTKLSEDEMEELDKHVDLLTTNAWHEGWKQGRESLGDEMKQKIDLSYEEGYNKGFDDGFEDGSDYFHSKTKHTQDDKQEEVQIQVVI